MKTTYFECAGKLFPISIRQTPSGAYLGYWFTNRGEPGGRCKRDTEADVLARIQADIARYAATAS